MHAKSVNITETLWQDLEASVFKCEKISRTTAKSHVAALTADHSAERLTKVFPEYKKKET